MTPAVLTPEVMAPGVWQLGWALLLCGAAGVARYALRNWTGKTK